MELLKWIGIALLTTLISLVLGRHHREYAMVAALAGGIVILIQILLAAIPIFNGIETWMEKTDLRHGEISILLRSMGICILTQFASDSCKDAGESALASKMELAGKISVVLIAMPLLQSVAELAFSLAGGAA